MGVGESAIKRIKATDIVKALQQIQGKGGGNASTARASLPSEYATKASEVIRQTVLTQFKIAEHRSPGEWPRLST
ncbi:hypothetical protein [Anaplasma phagocytophilum]